MHPLALRDLKLSWPNRCSHSPRLIIVLVLAKDLRHFLLVLFHCQAVQSQNENNHSAQISILWTNSSELITHHREAQPRTTTHENDPKHANTDDNTQRQKQQCDNKHCNHPTQPTDRPTNQPSNQPTSTTTMHPNVQPTIGTEVRNRVPEGEHQPLPWRPSQRPCRSLRPRGARPQRDRHAVRHTFMIGKWLKSLRTHNIL